MAPGGFQQLVDSMTHATPSERSDLGLRLMTELGWPAVTNRSLLNGFRAPILYFGAQNVDHIGLASVSDEHHEGRMLSHAYNRDVQWVISLDGSGIRMFNVLSPLRDGHVAPVFSSTWESARSSPVGFSLFTPEALYSGELKRRAAAQIPETQWGPTLVEYLLRHFDAWRKSLLYQGEGTEGSDLQRLDEQVHRFFTRLLFARYAEDLGWESPRSLVQASKRGVAALHQLFATFKASYDSSLFNGFPADAIVLKLSKAELTQLTEGLYHPTILNHLTLDFSTLDIDLLGTFYEAYLSSRPISSSTSNKRQTELPIARATLQDVKKQKGIYYTPRYVVHSVVSEVTPTIDAILKAGKLPVVYDPACGSGSFLVAAFNAILARLVDLKGTSYVNEAVRMEVLKRCIYGTDIDPMAVEATRLNLSLAATKSPHELPDLASNIRQGDALLGERPGFPRQFDVILGNPPFLDRRNRQALGDSYLQSIEEHYRSARGRYDLSYLFLELALQTVGQNGIIGMIVPSNLFIGHHGSPIRSVLSESKGLKKVVDFQANDLFPGVSNYVSIVIIQPGHREALQVIRVHDMPDSAEARSRQMYQLGLGLVEEASASGFQVELPSGDQPWLLVSDPEQSLLADLQQKAKPLDSEAVVRQGAKSANNSVFILRRVSVASDGLVRCESKNAGFIDLEPELLQTAVVSSTLRGLSEEPSLDTVALIPNNRHGVMPEEELSSRFPRSWQYLRSQRELLSSRNTAVKTWYAWHHIPKDWRQPKLITPDYAPRGRFSFDSTGELLPIGATFLVPRVSSTVDLEVLLGLLNSTLFSWLVASTSVERKGGYFGFYGKFIKGLPIIPPEGDFAPIKDAVKGLVEARVRSTGSEATEATATAKARRFQAFARAQSRLDEAVFELFSLSEPQVDLVLNSPLVARW